MAVLRQVAKTDTFEKQRQVINALASDLFSINAGGSDLQTGNLKLGDGTKDEPSLSFLSQGTLGLYKPEQNNLTFVSDTKKIFGYDASAAYFYKNFVLQKNELVTEGLTITKDGQNYDTGSYEDISVFGGTGSNGSINITISDFSGSVTNPGTGYQYESTGGLGGGGTQAYNNVFFAGGSGSGAEGTIVFVNGGFPETTFNNYGSGYQVGDILNLPADVVNVTVTIVEGEADITLADTSGIYNGWEIIQVSGPGTLEIQTDVLTGQALPITVQNVGIDGTTITTSTAGLTAGTATLTFRAPWNNVTGGGYQYTIQKLGVATEVSVNTPGNGYTIGDTLTINALDLTQPIDYLVSTIGVQRLTFTTAFNISVGASVEAVDNSGGGLGGGGGPTTDPNVGTVIEVNAGVDIVVQWTTGTASDGNDLVVNGGTTYVIDITNGENRFAFDFQDGNDVQMYPSFSLFKNNKYRFDVSGTDSQHPFELSIHPDGSRALISQSITLSDTSKVLNVTSTAGILVGMTVKSNNSDISETGVVGDAFVESVGPGNIVTITEFPTAAGSSTVEFQGVKYEGTEVSKDSQYYNITPTDETPATLYYYCENHDDMAGNAGNEASITINYNNPKIFGTEFELLVEDIITTNVISGDVASGDFNVEKITGTSVTVEDTTSTNVTAEKIVSDKIEVPLVSLEQNPDGSDLTTITALAGEISFNADSYIIGDKFTVVAATGTLTTDGILKTTNKVNVNDFLTLEDNVISTSTNNDIFLTPAPNRITKVDSLTALVIPSGTTLDRPGSNVVENGSIRFNSETNQYEGYSNLSGTGVWSSLGGVRDIDGNTYIKAEAFVGANDNTLYFYNDDANTLRLTKNYLDFRTTKKIRSANLTAPTYTNYNANIPLTQGTYVKWRNNIYFVTTGGVSASSGSEPTHTEGTLPNGSAELTWAALAVAPLTFEEIEELRIAPTGGTDLSINGELRLSGNKISTDVSDLIITPNDGKRVKIDATSHLQIPVGTEGQKSTGTADAGSIRYNTTNLQYEGFNGASWSSLGGVRDVNGDTYIKPEISPGSNEDILYFYNANQLSLQLTTNKLDFLAVDTVVSTDWINVNTPIVTFNNLVAALDTSGSDRTRLTTTRDMFELGFNPTGLANETMLRMNDIGEIWYNRALGSGGTVDLLRILDGDLKVFELQQTRQISILVPLERGIVNTGSAQLYSPATHIGTRVHAIAYNKTTGDKETMEFTVIDKGVDIYYTEISNMKTGVDLVTPSFDFAVGGEVRVSFTLNSALATNNLVDVVVISNVIKK